MHGINKQGTGPIITARAYVALGIQTKPVGRMHGTHEGLPNWGVTSSYDSTTSNTDSVASCSSPEFRALPIREVHDRTWESTWSYLGLGGLSANEPVLSQ